jgi:hypothetical protein
MSPALWCRALKAQPAVADEGDSLRALARVAWCLDDAGGSLRASSGELEALCNSGHAVMHILQIGCCLWLVSGYLGKDGIFPQHSCSLNVALDFLWHLIS